MGFLPDVRRILQRVPAERQTLLFSATMPADVRRLAHDVLREPVTVQVDRAAPATTVSHALYPVPQHLKTPLLLELLKHTDTESVLVFTRTKHRAKRLGEQLANAGYRASSLQGNLSQNRRQAALDGFRAGEFQILVATDIAARGIDVSTISHVVPVLKQRGGTDDEIWLSASGRLAGNEGNDLESLPKAHFVRKDPTE